MSARPGIRLSARWAAAALPLTLACGGGARDAGADELPAGAEPVAAFGTVAGLSAKYGSRDPRVCPSRKAPARGAPSNAQAAQYFVCYQEEEHNGYLYLAEDVRVEVGRGRPYQVATDAWEDIDPAQPVYPVHGGYVGYQCEPVRTARELANGFRDNRGANCTRTNNARATGSCFKSTFGDWTCVMVDKTVGVESYERGAAPPRGPA